jgi:threonylcarbamoyladenosine tRNA methylthiotransferase MtaB
VSTVAAASVGCKVSQADGEAALAQLAAAGLEQVADRADADVVVVHTCCVTAEAERKSRRLARRAAAGGRRVVVAGCAAALHPEQFAGEGVTVVARPDWAAVAAQLDQPAGKRDIAAHDGEPLRARTRLVLKVQDGCAGCCSYCVVRLVRGRPRGLALAEALDSARKGLARGCGEVVLSGIDLGAWADDRARLPDLVAAVAEMDGLRRVRLSSVEPRHLTPALLELLAHPRVARHLHVPLQSADDGVLRAMRRPYTFAEYARAVEGLRAVPGGAMLSTDVIVGYPTEDEDAFARTLAALESGLFGRAHVFAFSARPGTAAAELPPLPAATVKERMARALAAAGSAALAARRAAVGREAEVLVEERRDGLWRGYSSEYVRYALRGTAQHGELVCAVADAVTGDGVAGNVRERDTA